MDLFEEVNDNPIKNKEKNNNKTIKMIVIAIAIIFIIIIGIIIAMMYLKSSTMKLYIDGSQKNYQESYFQIDENNKIYISIQDMAGLLKVQYFNGTYGKISEDTSNGYVNFSDKEIVIFEANSNKIYKMHKEGNEEKYSYMYLDENIKFSNGKLYATPDGIMKILNVSFDYNKDINIYTLEYLNKYYTGKIEEYEYKKISDEYLNQIALKNNILIVEKENGKKGIIKTDGTEIAGAKYTTIQYMENTGEYLVSIGNKYGIINNQGKSKIDLAYDEIKVLDEDLGLYVVKQDNKYGVLNSNADIIIHMEFEEIGIDKSLYKDSDIKNEYLLFDNCIVVKRDNKYGIYNKGGKLILPMEYDGIGCVVGTSSSRSARNVVVVNEYEAIVIKKDKYYGLINSTGKSLIPCALDTIYSITTEGKTNYKIEGKQNDTPYSYDLEQYFDKIGVKKVEKNSEFKETNEINNLSNTTKTNTTTNQNSIQNENGQDNEEDYEEDDDE